MSNLELHSSFELQLLRMLLLPTILLISITTHLVWTSIPSRASILITLGIVRRSITTRGTLRTRCNHTTWWPPPLWRIWSIKAATSPMVWIQPATRTVLAGRVPVWSSGRATGLSILMTTRSNRQGRLGNIAHGMIMPSPVLKMDLPWLLHRKQATSVFSPFLHFVAAAVAFFSLSGTRVRSHIWANFWDHKEMVQSRNILHQAHLWPLFSTQIQNEGKEQKKLN